MRFLAWGVVILTSVSVAVAQGSWLVKSEDTEVEFVLRNGFPTLVTLRCAGDTSRN